MIIRICCATNILRKEPGEGIFFEFLVFYF